MVSFFVDPDSRDYSMWTGVLMGTPSFGRATFVGAKRFHLVHSWTCVQFLIY